MHIGVLTGGGDCPGLNAVIRAVAVSLINEAGARVTCVERGFLVLIERRVRPLDMATVGGIVNLGGTMLGIHNRANPFHYFGAGGADVSAQVVAYVSALGVPVWVRDAQGKIVGVHSVSERKPLRSSGFEATRVHLEW